MCVQKRGRLCVGEREGERVFVWQRGRGKCVCKNETEKACVRGRKSACLREEECICKRGSEFMCVI